MKQTILSLLFLLATFGAQAQQLTMPVAEIFETDGENSRYTSNSFYDNTLEYFQRATVAQGSNYPNFRAVALGDQQGTGFWVTEGARGQAGFAYARNSRHVTLNTIDARNYKDIVVKVAFAAPRGAGWTGGGNNAVRNTDRIRIRYSFDGGAFVTAGLLLGSNASGGGVFQQDTSSPLDSIPDAGALQLDAQFRDVTVSIPATGSALRVQVVVDSRQPELAFDNIRVTGTLEVATRPTLSNLGSTPVSYTEGGAAVQLTNTLVVGYSDNSATTLTGATVKVVNFQAQDQLNFINQNGIAGSYNTGNGILTLSGPASQAAYQTALQSVTYSSTNTTTLNGVSRQVEFQVYNGSALSNNPSRNVAITLTLNAPAALNYTENFDTDGESTRYFGNDFQSTSFGAGFFRSTTNPATGSSTTFGGVSGGFWYGDGTNITPNPTTPISTLQLAPVNAAGYIDLRFIIALGANIGWENSDYFKLYYRTNNGSWQEFGSLVGGGTNGAVSGNGVTLGTTLQDVTFNLPNGAAVANLDFKLELRSDVGEELAFDNIRITGTRQVAATVTTAAPTGVTGNSAVLGGSVPADGGATVTERGVVYSSTNTTPTTSNTKDTNGNGTGSFSETIAGLAPGTTYYVRAYAINSVDTSYGTVQIFTTTTTVTSIVRASNTNPTNAGQVSFTLTFATPVTGLTTSNFSLTTTGALSGASVASVSGAGTTYTVVVNTGSNSGTLQLNLGSSTGLTPMVSNLPYTSGEAYDIDKTRPSAAISSPAGTSGGTTTTSPIPFTVTFSENVSGFVAGDVTVTNGSITGGTVNGTSPGTVYTFTVTPTTAGTATTVAVPNNVAQDAAGNGNTGASASYSLTYNVPSTTVASVTRLSPNPTAMATVSYQVVFANSVTGVSTSNFSVTTTGTISGVSGASVSGSGTTYTVTVNTGTGNGTLRLNVQNSTGLSPTVTNVPYTTGEEYTITKSFTAAPTLRIQALGGSFSDVTAFVDVVQVLQSGTSTVVADGVQNGGFETNNVNPGSYLYQSQGVVAAPWTFGVQAGVSRNSNNGFASTAADGDAVAFLQSAAGNNGSVSQNLAVPTGSYQVSFRAIQRNYTTLDQRLNVFVNDVFVGNIQPNNIPTYDTFTSASFSVTAPALTATVSSTAAATGGSTATTPIPFSVSFSASVGTSFTAADVTVTNGTVTTGSFSGSGAGPYTFTVTPTAPGTATSVSLTAGVAQDANNTLNTASNAYSVTYNQPQTAAPVVTAPANGSTVTSATPTYTGTAPAGSTVTVYVDGSAIGTTTATAGTFTLTQPSALAQGSHTVRATAQLSGQAVSANSNTNTFTVATAATYTSSTAEQPNTERVAAGSTNQVILRVAVVIGGGSSSPLSAQSFSFTTNGSTAPADIAAARVYYTGASTTLSTTTAFGSAVTAPAGVFTVAGAQPLTTGTNYFWLVYDVAATASAGNVLDATVASLTIGGLARTPTITDPAGNRRVVATDGVAGTALRTTAGYASFSAGSLPALGSTYTQMAWIKRTGGSGSANYYVLGNGTNNTAAPYLYVTGNGRIGAGFGSSGAAQPQNAEFNSNVIAANEWNHVAATYTGSVLTVYLNGTAVATLTPTAAARTPAATAASFIGSAGTSGTNFPGDIDEVSQWNRALSQTEVRLLLHLTLSGTESGLVSYLQFNDAGTTTTDDISGAAATLTGATRTTSTAPVGFGVSNLQSVAATGNYSFTGTNAAINFTSVAGAPYDVVVFRLRGTPLGTQVSDANLRSTYSRAYWIVDKYSTSTFTAAITYTLDPGLITAGYAAAPSNLKLYKRGSNSDGAFEAPISATAADATTNTVTFPVSSFSQTLIGTYGSSPLPVELVRFTAERRGNNALLQWATAQELKNDYFEVESSVDGRTFRAVGRVTGHGTSSQPHSYQLTDADLARYARPVVYYRLRQVDQDGTSSLSSVQTVQVSGGASLLTAVVFPNPAADQLTVRLSQPYTGQAQGWVFDAQGRTIQELSRPLAADASPDINLSVSHLPNGVYTLRLVLDGQVIHQQIVVQH
ncbi:T9SS type A sorting domain-containing protein [Microvirga sp. STR05]|uniref:T9SS type A sorting domain-containing protein n=1 Tax=Hymenobacter duratus TaxID=2771356 RepID=A0ABR8JG34_9BACT|nr:LamG-like jellyroll fold domain-containing protein [Hymenobacter duratus]MBD2714347.1 T9SS type A sorting domain-containing protein [Hymenobacter duratus]MBR7949250.1 T9SS type A sorting domain-containing protein [Microvirga sp. STR05]